MKKKIKASRVEKSSSPVSSENKHPEVGSKKSTWKKLMSWMGWAVVYIFVFYLGNLTGEYVAAHMPLSSLQKINIRSLMPNVNLPKVSIKWNAIQLPTLPKATPTAPPARTQLVIIGGTFVAMPLEASTAEDREQFAQTIKSTAKPASRLVIGGSCEFTPAFVTFGKNAVIEVANTTTAKHVINLSTEADISIEPQVVAKATITGEAGIYPLLCDGAISGFFVVE